MISVIRGAGLAGMVRVSELDSNGLGEHERHALATLLDGARVAAPAPDTPVHPDEMAYEIRVAGAGDPAVARFRESTLPDGARALMAWVAEHPLTRSRLAPPGD